MAARFVSEPLFDLHAAGVAGRRSLAVRRVLRW